MIIRKITMDTGDTYSAVPSTEGMSTNCPKCAFYGVNCAEIPCAEGGFPRYGYWVKVDDKPVTNGDRIRQMSDEEIAKIIFPSRCPKGHRPCDGDCRPCFLDWLESEHKGKE